MSKLVSPDEQSAYKRWELPDVEGNDEAIYSRLLTAGQLEKIQKQAYEEGFKQGEAAGYKSGEQQVAQAVAHLKQVINLFAQPLEELDEQVVQQLLELTTIISGQVIRRELRTDPGQVIGVVRECLKSLPIAVRTVNIYLHPDDALLVKAAFAIDDNMEQNWRIVEDPILTRGGCRVEADHSTIDATVEQQLNRVIANLLGGERGNDAE